TDGLATRCWVLGTGYWALDTEKHVTLRFIPRFRLADAGLRVAYLRPWNRPNPRRHRAHKICRRSHQAGLLDHGRDCRNVHDQSGELSGDAGASALDVHRGHYLVDGGADLRAEVPWGTALGQDARRLALPAFGVGEADTYTGDCQVFRRPPPAGALLAGFCQGGSDRGISHDAGFGTAGSGYRPHLYPDCADRTLPGGVAGQAGTGCGPSGRFDHAPRLAQAPAPPKRRP